MWHSNMRGQIALSVVTGLYLICHGSCELDCENSKHCSKTEWINQWYIWLVVTAGVLLLMFGITCACLRCWYLRQHHHPERGEEQPYEVTVIAIDHDSTIQSTMTCESCSVLSAPCSIMKQRYYVCRSRYRDDTALVIHILTRSNLQCMIVNIYNHIMWINKLNTIKQILIITYIIPTV
ncbi:transmembrane protein 52B isoform X1 [Rana temporaria]|uniref:transmembrane protein 52B isoform X1 n=1 Tax=Rana temporaria TaxID=8407 RepID=UPI001AADFC1C|nr:transmembrane protein 52B isoform X1 [Rana temporaria]